MTKPKTDEREARNAAAIQNFPSIMRQSCIAYDDDFLDERGELRAAHRIGWEAALQWRAKEDVVKINECPDCDGCGHFSSYGKPSCDKTDRECFTCLGSGEIEREETNQVTDNEFNEAEAGSAGYDLVGDPPCEIQVFSKTGAFIEGARWQHSRDRAKIAELESANYGLHDQLRDSFHKVKSLKANIVEIEKVTDYNADQLALAEKRIENLRNALKTQASPYMSAHTFDGEAQQRTASAKFCLDRDDELSKGDAE